MTIVVSDTSPIRALEFVGKLDLLAKLSGRVIVPPAVVKELRFPAERYRSVDVSQFAFLEIVAPTRNQEVQRLRTTLDAGESEALVLAVELSAELILMDERVGREAARRMRLRMVGTIGVLQRAKKAGLVSAIRPLIDDIINGSGFFLSQELVDSVLKQEGEA